MSFFILCLTEYLIGMRAPAKARPVLPKNNNPLTAAKNPAFFRKSCSARPPADYDGRPMEPDFLHQGVDGALFLSTFTLIFLAELPDKTAMAALLMASRSHPFAVFWGTCAAFVVQNLVAVTFGSLFGLFPPHIVHICSGILFLAFAVLMWNRRDEKEKTSSSKTKAGFAKTVWTAFGVIFIAEWGDLTQLAAATLVAKTRQPLTIFLSATLALWLTTAIAVTIGHHAKKIIRPHLLQTIAAIAFGIVGVLLLAGFWDK